MDKDIPLGMDEESKAACDELTNEVMDCVRFEAIIDEDSDRDDRVYTQIYNIIHQHVKKQLRTAEDRLKLYEEVNESNINILEAELRASSVSIDRLRDEAQQVDGELRELRQAYWRCD